MRESCISCYLVINDHVEWKENIPLNRVRVIEGNLYLNDPGRWPIINDPSEAFDRQRYENVRWAKNRLPWAREEAPREIQDLEDVIQSNGYVRNTVFAGKALKNFKALRDNKND